MPDASANPLAHEALYFGTGEHVCGTMPPIMVENALTEAYNEQRASRPGAFGLQTKNADLGLLYMVPIGFTKETLIPEAVLSALVLAADRGRGILVHAETNEAALHVAMVVAGWSGGGWA